MKIAYLPFSPQFVKYARNLLLGLLDRKHDVKVFTTHLPPSNADNSYLDGFDITYVPWSWFEFKELLAYNPELIITWNGFAPWTYAAMNWLKHTLGYRTLHLERGWLPQKGNFYIAENLAAHSHFIMDMPKRVRIDKKGIEKLRALYKPVQTDSGLPERFVFVPAQLDEDTSITISSTQFKNCDSFLGALRYFLPDIPIVVKNHPKFTEKSRSSLITLYEGPMTSMELAAQSTVVAGITSTVLTEALIYNKPVASFGYNVGMYSHMNPSHGIARTSDIFEQIKDIYLNSTEFKPPRAREEMLSWLLSKQWPGDSVPKWVIDYIEDRT
jgi:hypothetical protein